MLKLNSKIDLIIFYLIIISNDPFTKKYKRRKWYPDIHTF